MNQLTSHFFSHSLEFLQQQYSSFFEQPIIQVFLQNPEHLKIFTETLDSPSTHNICHLNETFKIFYYRAKVYKYMCSLIYFFSVDFDKRARKQRERYRMVLDATPRDTGGLIDRIGTLDVQLEKMGETNELASHISDEEMIKALKKLTAKQNLVLTMIFSYGLSNKEIAAYFQESPQNISSIRKQALKKLRKHYMDEVYVRKEKSHCG
ncbi:sigma-70 family RNA polymerase sigma factor [Peribacillus frigoritolerans]|jgi:RNA polymerase sigma factor (sigma-70 family)|uniref:sigma-70 family RNA polymerase sigma factor n=1 Tax=Peribacillus frigoritolerans TaxID=450367 RepID=UPI0025A0E8DE|nr:sigma-70 family RNA polymerase sigma factor [Peribacillus frigoritolerans]MDM5312015.1 sigma-70 family RNA polymerase sigma factor [Peribacillus frigoritolerans]